MKLDDKALEAAALAVYRGPTYNFDNAGLSDARKDSELAITAYLTAIEGKTEWCLASEVPSSWEGKSAWLFNEKDPTQEVALITVPTNFNRSKGACAHIWMQLHRKPAPPREEK